MAASPPPARTSPRCRRSAGQLDVFVVGTDGGVYTSAWEPGFTAGGTAGGGSATRAFPQGAMISAVSRSPDKLDIFATDINGRDPDGGLGAGVRRRLARLVGTPRWPGAPGRPVTAVSRSADKLDVFVTGTDGGVYTAAWEPAFTDWWHGWWRIGNGRCPQGAYVGAVSRSADKLDIFATDAVGGSSRPRRGSRPSRTAGTAGGRSTAAGPPRALR